MSGAARGQAKGQEEGQDERMCTCCGVAVGMKVCSGCHSVHYCGPVCQKSHWKGGHKKQCAQLGQAYAEERHTAAASKFFDGKIEGMKKQLEKSLQVQQEHAARDGKGNAMLGRTLVDVGSVLCEQGKPEQALEKLMEGLQISRKEVGPDHQDVVVALNCIGSAYVCQGKFELGLRKHQEALEILLRAYGPEHPLLAGTYKNIGCAFGSLQDYDKAIENLEKALSSRMVHPAFSGSIYRSLANVLVMQKKYSEALRRYRDALQVLVQVIGFSSEHPECAAIYFGMGQVFYQLGQSDKALEYLNKALAIDVKVLGSDHPAVASTQYVMACVYIDQGSYARAKELLEGYVKVYTRVYGANHSETQKAIQAARQAEAGLAGSM